MNSKLLNLKPIRYLCPYCGEWHPWEGTKLIEYHSYPTSTTLRCPIQPQGCRKGNLEIYISESCLFYNTEQLCNRARLNLDGCIEISNITEDPIEARVLFSVPFRAYSTCNYSACENCSSRSVCQVCQIGERDNSKAMQIFMGFEFERSEFEAIIKEDKKMARNTTTTTTVKTTDATTTTALQRFLTSTPQQWIDTAKAWGENHKSTLQWGVAVGAVAIAAKLLKDNKQLAERGKDMGLPFLDKKSEVKRLVALGGVYAAAYGFSKTLIPSKKEDLKAATEKAGEMATKNPSWEKRAEQVLPTAISIIIAYAIMEKPDWLTKVSESSNELFIKVQTYLGIAKDVILDKLGIDDQQAKRIMICVGVAAFLAFLYKGVKNKEKLNEMVQQFIELSVTVGKELAPPAFAALAAVLVNEQLWPEDVIDVAFSEAETEEAETEEAKAEAEEAEAKPKRGRKKATAE